MGTEKYEEGQENLMIRSTTHHLPNLMRQWVCKLANGSGSLLFIDDLTADNAAG